jgi:transcriptional regulator with XRE-family HTH domain
MDKMSKFGERLNELITDQNITPEQLSSCIGVSVSTIYRWKKNETKLLLSNLVALSNYLNCSTDFLLGRSNNEEIPFAYKNNLPKFSIRLREVMKEKGISTYRLRKETQFDGKYFEKWDKGTDPLAITIIELADILDCSVDYLIGRTN